MITMRSSICRAKFSAGARAAQVLRTACADDVAVGVNLQMHGAAADFAAGSISMNNWLNV